MNINIKLKDCTLLSLASSLDIREKYDFYGNFDRPVQSVSFLFDDDSTVFFYDIDEYSGTFCYLIDFFYNKDFSETTKQEFIDSFSNYVDVEAEVRKK
jgi:hypothetical protein